ncbi:hypothetical protein [Chondromyces crocatus]|uniref:Uncharacterized protein n=1 Tax=Chondromyces crocatus TaxID=52 RepID=A0A0K1E9L3_CHOCO|nr:hypothetical protein [Chondromyces crocatus]AKT37273.1 uncharacterized protein CMC5_014040 [Chondromyces crocatus]
MRSLLNHRGRAWIVISLAGLGGLVAAVGACSPPTPTPTAESAPVLPAAPAPAAPPEGAPGAAPQGEPGSSPEARPCMDIRAALVRCPDGEEITHEGCAGEEYNKRCAPKRGP